LPPAAQQRESVDFRQPQIENHRVVSLGMREEIGPLAIAGAVDSVPSFGERFRQLPGKAYFVLDDQKPQLDIL
jgi:hypothetical protein